jgi:hypothetical protein
VKQRFDKANLQLNPEKFVFAQPRVNYLVYVLSDKGVTASSYKVKAVKDYSVPINVKDVRVFFGQSSFYRSLVQNFATIAKARTELTKKDRPFTWEREPQNAFDGLKDTLCKAPVSAYPNFSLM